MNRRCHFVRQTLEGFKSYGPMPKDLVAKGIPIQKKGFLI
jgi:hypothetical protein